MSQMENQVLVEGQAETLAPQGQLQTPRLRKKNKNVADYIFCAVMLLFPTAQFLVFYVATNANSFLLMFQEWTGSDFEFAWNLDNFRKVFQEIGSKTAAGRAIGVSMLVYVIHLVVTLPLGIIASYYIFKKFIGGRFFKIMLFMPQIVSIFTMCVIYKEFTIEVSSKVFNVGKFNLLYTGIENEHLFTSITFAYIVFGFGGSMLMYLGAMSGISDSILEAAKIDGAGNTSELFRIILPQIFPTIKTFLIVGIATIFSNQFNLLSLFGYDGPLRYRTLGYYLYQPLIAGGSAQSQYPYLAAFGIVISAVLIPITLLINKWLDKLDPTAA